MSILQITGGAALNGRIRVQGAKNAALPILSASLLAEGETVIHNCPRLSDVDAAIKILEHLGCGVSREGDTVCVDPRKMTGFEIPHELMREMRSSVIFLGAILARCKTAVLSLPGGCELGPRPIDLHLSALRTMGAEIEETGGNIVCRAGRLHGERIDFTFPSVGATENAMLASVACEGRTVITNAAREPEIWDLQCYLRELGYNVSGAGSPVIEIDGRIPRASTEHAVIPDRIAAATYLSAAAAAGGDIELENVIPEHYSTVTAALEEMGCVISVGHTTTRLTSSGRLRASKPISTKPYPGFPTDAQPPLLAASLRAEGTTVFVENIFENRFRHCSELMRMGADIKLEGRVAMVSGVDKLIGAPVSATDLRGGAALVVAALSAEGTTEISELHHIDRGYEKIEEELRGLGANVVRVEKKPM